MQPRLLNIRPIPVSSAHQNSRKYLIVGIGTSSLKNPRPM